MKKLLSWVLVLVMILSVSAVNAEASGFYGDINLVPNSWSIRYLTNRTKWNNEQDYAAVSKEHYSGNAGLCVNIQSPKESSRYISVGTNLSAAFEANSTYRISFWVKGSGQKFSTVFAGWTYRQDTSKDFAVEKTDGDWQLLYKDIEITDVPAGTDFIMLLEDNMNIVIDDISVKKVINDDAAISFGNEMVKNGGFEDYTANPVTFDISDEPSYKSVSWNVEYSTNRMNFSVDYARPTKKYARSGDYAMAVNFGSTKAQDWYFAAKNTTKVKLAAGKYTLELWMKGSFDAVEAIRTGLFRNDPMIIGIGNMEKGETDEKGWTRYYKTMTLENNAENDFWILMQDKCSGVIDDVKLYSTDSPEINLIEDGGFDNCVQRTVAENRYNMADWGVNVNNINLENCQNEIFAEASKKEAYSNEYSLHAAFPYGTFNNTYLRIYQDNRSFPAGNYHLSFYAKGDYPLFQIGIGWDAGDNGFKPTNNNIFTKTEVENGWIKYDADLSIKNNASYFHIIVDRFTDVYIDDIVLTKEGSSDNMILNGNFEKSSEKPTELINPIAYPVEAGGMVNISWTNPNNNNIDDIKIYVDGVESKNTVIDKSASAFNEFLIGNLKNYQRYTFKIVTVINGKEDETVLSAVPDNKGRVLTLGDWSIFRYDRNINNLNYYSNFNASLDRDEKASDDSSIRMDVNLPTRIDGVYPNVYQAVRLNKAKLYCIKFKAKAKDINRFQLIEEGSGIWHTTNFINSSVPVSEDWKEYTHIAQELYDPNYVDDYVVNLRFAVDQAAGSLWLDDIELYEIDVYDDKIISDNLLKNGGFEYAGYEISRPSYSLIVDDDKFDITALEAGNIEVKTQIKNYGKGNNFNVFFAVALYNGSRLESLTTSERIIPELPYDIPADEVVANVNVPDLDSGDYKLKVMYWDGLDTMKPVNDDDVLLPLE